MEQSDKGKLDTKDTGERTVEKNMFQGFQKSALNELNMINENLSQSCHQVNG